MGMGYLNSRASFRYDIPAMH